MTATITQTKPSTFRHIDQLLSKQVFFIVGCQKSGTTWVQRMLDGHPDIRCHGEAYFAPVLMPLLQQAIQGYNERQKAGQQGLFTDDDLRVLLRTAVGLSFARWVGDTDVQAIGEKTPENALCMNPLLECFPNAKFIHITRDGRDVCVSGWFHNQRKSGPDFAKRFPDLNTYIKYTVKQHWLPYIQHAQAFGQQHPEHYHELRYEDLHQDPIEQTRNILRFLGMDDSDSSTDACLAAGSFKTLTQGRTQGEEDKASFFRKGVIGDWQNHFNDSNLATYNQAAGNLPSQLGYT
jgi:Sulfotransferase family